MENKIYVRFMVGHVKGFAYTKGEEGWVDRDKVAHAIATGQVQVIDHPVPRVMRPEQGEVRYATRGKRK